MPNEWDGTTERRRQSLEMYESLQSKLNAMNTTLEVALSKMTEMKKTIDSLHSEIFGREEAEGLKMQTKKIIDLDKALRDHKTEDRWLFGIGIGFLITILGVLLHQGGK